MTCDPSLRADVHQAHRVSAPTAPAFGELLRADQEVDARGRLIEFVEDRASNSRGLVIKPLSAQSFSRSLASPTLMMPKSGLSPSLSAISPSAPFTFSTRRAPPFGALNTSARTRSKISSGAQPGLLERTEAAVEHVVAVRADETFAEHAADVFHRRRAVTDEALEEHQHADDVRDLFLALLADRLDASADEDPQGRAISNGRNSCSPSWYSHSCWKNESKHAVK